MGATCQVKYASAGHSHAIGFENDAWFAVRRLGANLDRVGVGWSSGGGGKGGCQEEGEEGDDELRLHFDSWWRGWLRWWKFD